MKKFATALLAGSLALIGFGSVANGYPPFERLVTVDKSPIEAGDTLTATANCAGLEVVTFVLGDSTATATCNGTDDEGATSAALVTSGTASAALVAPVVPGEFIVTAAGSFSADLGSTQVIVTEQTAVLPDTGSTPTTVASPSPTDVLPATGSGGIGVATGLALSLLTVGMCLFVIATIRRRQPILD